LIEILAKNIDDVWFGVAYDGESVLALTFGSNEQRAIESLQTSLPHDTPCKRISRGSCFGEHAIEVVKTVYDGKDVACDLSLDMRRLTGYTRRILETTMLVPAGYVTSYGAIAKAAGGGPRAVGNAMASNPFAPIVPCHRVISSNLTLGGYGGGLKMKLEFLKRERRGHRAEREIRSGNLKLKVFPVEVVLKKLESNCRNTPRSD